MAGPAAVESVMLVVGKREVVIASTHGVTSFGISNGEVVEVPLPPSSSSSVHMRANRANDTVAVWRDTCVYVYSLPGMSKVCEIEVGKKVVQVEVVSSKGEREVQIITADRNADIELHSMSLHDNKLSSSFLCGHTSTIITDLLLSPDRNYLISTDRNEKVRVSHFPSTHEIEAFCLGHKMFVTKAVIPSSSPSILLTGSGDGTVRVWDYISGKCKVVADLSVVIGVMPMEGEMASKKKRVEEERDTTTHEKDTSSPSKRVGRKGAEEEGTSSPSKRGGKAGRKGEEDEELNDEEEEGEVDMDGSGENVVSQISFHDASKVVAVSVRDRSIIVFYLLQGGVLKLLGKVDTGHVVADMDFDEEGKLFVVTDSFPRLVVLERGGGDGMFHVSEKKEVVLLTGKVEEYFMREGKSDKGVIPSSSKDLLKSMKPHKSEKKV